MMQFLRDNKGAVAWLGAALAFLIVLFVVAGCSVADFIKVRAPTTVQQTMGVPPKVPLSEAGMVLDGYKAKVEADFKAKTAAGQAFAENIERGWVWVGFLDSVFQAGLAEAEASGVATLPGGALALALLTGLGGLFLPKPGAGTKLRTEKEDSYNAGLEAGKRLALEAASGKA